MSGRFQAPHTPSGAEEAPGFGKEETTDTENLPKEWPRPTGNSWNLEHLNLATREQVEQIANMILSRTSSNKSFQLNIGYNRLPITAIEPLISLIQQRPLVAVKLGINNFGFRELYDLLAQHSLTRWISEKKMTMAVTPGHEETEIMMHRLQASVQDFVNATDKWRQNTVEPVLGGTVKWQKRQDKILEKKCTDAVKTFLEEQKKTPQELAVYKGRLVDSTGKAICEIDGLLQDEAKTFHFIEAKQHVDKSNFEKATATYKAFEDYLRSVRGQGTASAGNMTYRMQVASFAAILPEEDKKLDIKKYLGGAVWERGMQEEAESAGWTCVMRDNTEYRVV